MRKKESWVLILSLFFFTRAVQSEDISLDLQLPGTVFLTGSPFKLDLEITNIGPDYPDAVVLVAVNVGTDDYWFFPSWLKYPPDIDLKLMDIQGFMGSTLNIISEFDWPADTGIFFDASFIAAIVASDGELISNIPVVPFGWTSNPIIDNITPASGPPGKLLKITGRGFNLSSGDIKLGMGVYQFPVTSSGVDEEGKEFIITVIPPLDSASYDVKLIAGGVESNSISLFIDEMASSGKPLGQVVTEISQGMNAI